MTETGISSVRWIDFWQLEHHGLLSVFPGNDPAGVPFPIARVFTISGVPSGGRRANHAHRTCAEVLVCVAGRLEVTVRGGDDNAGKFELKNDGRGLLIPPLNWITVIFEDPRTVLLAICDALHDEADYVRDWKEYLELTGGPL